MIIDNCRIIIIIIINFFEEKNPIGVDHHSPLLKGNIPFSFKKKGMNNLISTQTVFLHNQAKLEKIKTPAHPSEF